MDQSTSNGLTYEIWVKYDGDSNLGYGRIMGVETDWGPYLSLNYNENINTPIGASPNQDQYTYGSNDDPGNIGDYTNNLIHIVCNWEYKDSNGHYRKTYVNGVKYTQLDTDNDGYSGLPGFDSFTTNIDGGNFTIAASNQFNSIGVRVYGFRVWHRILSDNEVTELYEKGANYSYVLDQDLYDSSENTIDYTLVDTNTSFYGVSSNDNIGHDNDFGYIKTVVSKDGSTIAYISTSYNIYVYRYDGSQWNEISTTDIKNSINPYMALCLSYDGTILGCTNPNSSTSTRGKIMFFKYDNVNDEWNTYGNTIFGKASFDNLATSMSINDDATKVIIGGRNGSQFVGYMSIYKYIESSNTWTLDGSNSEITGSVKKERVGHYVFMSGDGNTVAYSATDRSSIPTGYEGYAKINILKYSDTNDEWVFCCQLDWTLLFKIVDTRFMKGCFSYDGSVFLIDEHSAQITYYFSYDSSANTYNEDFTIRARNGFINKDGSQLITQTIDDLVINIYSYDGSELTLLHSQSEFSSDVSFDDTIASQDSNVVLLTNSEYDSTNLTDNGIIRVFDITTRLNQQKTLVIIPVFPFQVHLNPLQ